MSQLPLTALPLEAPLRWDGGVIRIGTSRISLDVIVEQHELGNTPEKIVRAYDTLSSADVKSTIDYYLSHQVEIRDYLRHRSEEATELREQIEAERPRMTREELSARRAAAEVTHAAVG